MIDEARVLSEAATHTPAASANFMYQSSNLSSQNMSDIPFNKKLNSGQNTQLAAEIHNQNQESTNKATFDKPKINENANLEFEWKVRNFRFLW